MNNNRERLRQWFEKEKANGLKDVKFFPGEKDDVSIEQAAERVLEVVTKSDESVDITDEIR